MSQRLNHRGPDGDGFWHATHRDWTVGLGHRRLSIIDLKGGAQPLGNEDGTVQITFNGEIYNYRELRTELEARGHRFATRSDTEAIVHHYEQRGTDGLEDLDGMFAFAIWDANQGQLTLARDRSGIKPVYYAALPNGGLVFGSELTALLAHPGLKRAIDPLALPGYLFSDYVHPTRSMVRGIQKLAPGHFVVWENGRLSAPRPFWQLGEDEEAPLELSENEAAEMLRSRIAAAVERQLVADVPVGVFLSGGLDSSFIAATAQKQVKGRLRTFSVRFEDSSFDESAYARTVAKHIGSEHFEETLREGDLLDVLEDALSCLDEPMADPSLLPTFLLARSTRRHVKVALSGDAGDELFGGYPTYQAHFYSQYYGLIPGLLRDHLITPVVSRMPVGYGYQPLEWKAKRFTQRWDINPLRRHMRWMSATDLPDLARLLPDAGQPEILDVETIPRFRDPGNALLALDFCTYMPGSVLAKVDRASMANGLEVRPPYLDNALIEWAFSLPASRKFRRGDAKRLLKLAAAPQLPREITGRKKKGFGIPLAAWLRGPLRPRLERMLADSPLWTGRAMPGPAIAREWQTEHQNGIRDHSKTLWSLLVLDHWMKKEGVYAES
jgi:asparagine synthase (glutamine-hydrolysing)